jgi:hypothetical protein
MSVGAGAEGHPARLAGRERGLGLFGQAGGVLAGHAAPQHAGLIGQQGLAQRAAGGLHQGDDGQRPAALQRGAHGVEEGRLQRLDEDVDAAATGQAHFPGCLVGDAKVQQLGPALLQRLDAFLVHRAFHAAAADRAGDVAGGGHGHLGAGLARRGAPGLDDGGEGDGLVLGVPVGDGGCDVAHTGLNDWRAREPSRPAPTPTPLARRARRDGAALRRRTGGEFERSSARLHPYLLRRSSSVARWVARSSRLARLWTGRKSSM